ncbi:DNA-3-methyladenine glycosylase [hydrothermal vent metagenome]|uniref:DNA-3-methyladenine glycosylase n=1 Tax=hydrothermal vent metagenome TaxID=652676 RepID=A0A3B0RUW0_9ZZZZ
MSIRCGWVPPNDPLYCAYHDEEWGVPEYDSRALWEKLVLDGMQAGLAWITILRKRDTIRAAFAGFDPQKVAGFDDTDMERLLQDKGIIRSRAKCQATIDGARLYLDMQDKGENFSDYMWEFVGGQPIQNNWANFRDAPTKTALSEQIAKDLKSRGFKFCGPVIVYAFMQAVGMINDHSTDCHCYQRIKNHRKTA